MSRRRIGCVAVGTWLFLAVVSGARAGAEVTNRIVATIDGDPVTAYELRRYARERGGENAPEKQVLDALVTDRLLEKEVAAQGIAVKDDEIDRYIEEIRNRNRMDPMQFERALAAQGMTPQTYRARVKMEIERAQLVNREIRQRVNVSPEEVERYYDAHRSDYSLDEKVTVQTILFALPGGASDDEVEQVRQKATEVRDMARSGKDFGDLVRQFSDGPAADKDGEIGTFGRNELDPSIADAVARLKEGEVSDPVRTGNGFHVLRVKDRVEGGHRSLEDVTDEIKNSLYNEALEQRFQNWLSRDLRERHHVEILD